LLSVCNSTLRLAPPSYALDSAIMLKSKALTELKKVRRDRLRLLWDTFGGAELARMTGIDKSYLYQMAMGKGRNARGISDDNAALVESAAGKPEGWLSGHAQEVREDPAVYGCYDRALLRSAIIQVERKLAGLTKSAADLRADIILGVYDMLVAGRSEEAVAGFLSGIQFAPPNRTM